MKTIDKICIDHPDLAPKILSSGNSTHIAYACCVDCGRFLGWIGRQSLVDHIESMATEVDRLKSILEFSRIKDQLDAAILSHNGEISTDAIWKHLMNQMLPATRDLFAYCGRINSIEFGKVTITVKTETMKTIAIGKIPELTKILNKILGHSMTVELAVEAE
jgi:hypothetical protein